MAKVKLSKLTTPVWAIVEKTPDGRCIPLAVNEQCCFFTDEKLAGSAMEETRRKGQDLMVVPIKKMKVVFNDPRFVKAEATNGT